MLQTQLMLEFQIDCGKVEECVHIHVEMLTPERDLEIIQAWACFDETDRERQSVTCCTEHWKKEKNNC